MYNSYYIMDACITVACGSQKINGKSFCRWALKKMAKVLSVAAAFAAAAAALRGIGILNTSSTYASTLPSTRL